MLSLLINVKHIDEFIYLSNKQNRTVEAEASVLVKLFVFLLSKLWLEINFEGDNTPIIIEPPCYSTRKDFQYSPDDEEDSRSSQENLNNLEEEYQARALLAKSRSSSASSSKPQWLRTKGLIVETYEWDEKEVSSDENETTKVKVLMALADDENLVVDKESAKMVNGIFLTESQRNTTNPPIIVTDSSAIDLLFLTILKSNYTFKAEVLKGITITEPYSASAKTKTSASKVILDSGSISAGSISGYSIHCPYIECQESGCSECSSDLGVQNVGNQNGLIVVSGIANPNANQIGNNNVIAARANQTKKKGRYLSSDTVTDCSKEEAGLTLRRIEIMISWPLLQEILMRFREV
ncbi:hypothetical protein Tco_1575365 [Tanacetum coccineum]